MVAFSNVMGRPDWHHQSVSAKYIFIFTHKIMWSCVSLISDQFKSRVSSTLPLSSFSLKLLFYMIVS